MNFPVYAANTIVPEQHQKPNPRPQLSNTATNGHYYVFLVNYSKMERPDEKDNIVVSGGNF